MAHTEEKGGLDRDAISGILLVIAAAAALIVANSPLQTLYQSYLQLPVSVKIGSFGIDKPLLLWVIA